MKYTVNLKRYNISINKHLSEYKYLEINDNELIIKDYIDSKVKFEDAIDSKENSEDKLKDKEKGQSTNISNEELTKEYMIFLAIVGLFSILYIAFQLIVIIYVFFVIIRYLLVPFVTSLFIFLFHAFLTNPIFMAPFAILSLI
ncbi:MAG: hypothetical protein HC785_27065 [Calothrix sp. CSU_2_0]|nr:hypothetical protein [Calothrix sp. CSU_2_0]